MEYIQLAEVQNEAHGYCRLLGIVNFIAPLPSPLTASPLTHLSDGRGTQARLINIFFHRVRSDIIVKAIEGSITKIYLKKLRLHRKEY